MSRRQRRGQKNKQSGRIVGETVRHEETSPIAPDASDTSGSQPAPDQPVTGQPDVVPSRIVKFWNRLKRLPGDLAIGLILVGGYFLRSIGLDLKPPHFDEGINGFFVQKLWREGYYHYDPNNFHGPLYFYILAFTELFSGRSIVGYRFANGLISLAVIALVARHRRFFGKSAIWAALITGVSTGFVFYSRYAIHESLFIFCQVLFSYGYFLWQEQRSRKSLACMAIGFFATIAIKETFFIFFMTWGIAAVAVKVFQRWRQPVLTKGAKRKSAKASEANLKVSVKTERTGFWNQEATIHDWIYAVSIGCFFLMVLFTGFFINPSGLRDMFTAYAVWTKTGTANSGHEKPFFYWIDLLYRYEWPALISLACCLPIFFFLESRKRLIALLAFGVWLSYSIIPYKTPWLILNILWPLAFVFGFIIEQIPRIPSWTARQLCRLVLLASLVANIHVMLRLNFQDFARATEPYVYVQSTNQMKYVIDFISERVQKFPEELNMKLLVLVRDPWPLPWLFASYPRLTYGAADKVELDDASVIMIDGAQQKALEDRLTQAFYRLRFQIRDSYEGGFCYFNFDKFKGIVPSDSEVVGPSATRKGSAGSEPTASPGVSK